MTRKLVVANQKGGVGKSTTVLNLGMALAELDYSVLLLDLDPQGGLSASVGVDIFNTRLSTYSLLFHEKVSLARLIKPVSRKLGLVPASTDLASAEMLLGTAQDAPFRLRNALGRSRIPFDFMIMDTPPSLGLLTANALAAGNELLIPVQCQYLAMRGVRALLEILPQVQEKINADLRLLGIVGTMYRPNSLHAQEVIEEIRNVFPQETFQTLIHDSDMVAEAPVNAQSVLKYAPDDRAAAAYRDLAQEIVDERRRP